MKHVNIVQFLGATIKPPHLYIVLEYCARGSLFDVLKNPHVSSTQLIPLHLLIIIFCRYGYPSTKRESLLFKQQKDSPIYTH